MEQKYLPIGSVCTLKGKNKKVMIIGYYSVEFKGNLTIKDYYGCSYPEGLLLPENVCNFNHSDIETINFLGYKNEEEKTFESLLNRLTGNVSDEEKAKEFHENNDMFLTSNKSYSKLLFDENGVVMIADSVTKSEKEENKKLNNIRFDENGTVISVENSNVNNPFHKEYTQENNIDNKQQFSNIFKNIEFDENGTVVSTESNIDEKKNSMLNDIKFDENGMVISANGKEFESSNSNEKFKFDENGILISDGDNTVDDEVENIPPIGPGLPNYQDLANKELEDNALDITTNIPSKEESLSNVEFDENGMVISANDKKFESANPNNKFKFDENGTVIGVE